MSRVRRLLAPAPRRWLGGLIFILVSGASSLAAQRPIPVPAIEVWEADVLELQRAMDEGRVTAVDLVDAYMARIRAYEQDGPQLNAILFLNPRAHVEAAALDAERAARGARGPLHGIPVLLKDNIDTADLPTTGASFALAGSVPPDDALVVQRLRAAGAVILGKTNMHELAIGVTTVSSMDGQTRNPYDPTRNPGGSSGGTGAAVAASFAALGYGTDTCGSIRIPAAFNALFGMRTTWGLISTDGVIPLGRSQDVVGPLARTVTDLAIGLDAITGSGPASHATASAGGSVTPAPPHFADPSSRSVDAPTSPPAVSPTAASPEPSVGPPPSPSADPAARPAGTATTRLVDAPIPAAVDAPAPFPPFVDALRPDALEGARIGVLEFFLEPVLYREDLEALRGDPRDLQVNGDDAPADIMAWTLQMEEMEAEAAVVRGALEEMQELGARIVQVRAPRLDSLLEGTDLVDLEFKFDLQAYLDATPDAPIDSLGDILDRGLYHPSLEATLLKRNAVSSRDSEEYRRTLARREVLRAAVLRVMEEEDLDALAYPTMRREPASLGGPQNGSTCHLSAAIGFPALALPAGFDAEGLPVGVELLGRPMDDARLVGYAYAYEQAVRPRRPPPSTPPLSAEEDEGR